MVHALDEGVGRILRALDDRGIAENTLVLFFSDNGGGLGAADNGPYRGTKSTVFEGGTRVAAAARWPAGGISGGGLVTAPVAYIDVLPTLMDIAGLNDRGGKELDGRNVRDVLAGADLDGPERDLYSFVGQKNPEREQVSVMSGAWKLVVIGPPLDRPGSARASEQHLYRIEEDPFEERNLAADHPDVAARLLRKARVFRALQPPNPVESFGVGMEGFEPPPNWQFPGADATESVGS